MKSTEKFGTAPLGKLLAGQAIPAAVGILTMSIYAIVDTIFVGQFVGPEGIGAITVVLPITFLISSIGMAIGVGGSSVLSRALGNGKLKKAYKTFGNQVLMTLVLAIFFVILGAFFTKDIIHVFGGKGDVEGPAVSYFTILLVGIPFLAWAMMSINVIRAEGYPRVAMFAMVIPAIINLILDPIFIVVLDMGIEGAAWATTISYVGSAAFTLRHFLYGKSVLKISFDACKPSIPIIKEISALGAVTLARQGVISLLAIVLNNSLYFYGGEQGLSVYGIVNRVLMFANFPVLGITQGFVPIVGYNYGASLKKRVKKIVKISVGWASAISFLLFILLMVFAADISQMFTSDQTLIDDTTPVIRTVFLATPLLAVSLIISAYFQAIGKAGPALFLALTKQGIFLIPLVLLLPLYFGLNGIWMSFPIADIGAALVSFLYYKLNQTKYPNHVKSTSIPQNETLSNNYE
ncbi:MATE family efflux transporter [Brumimicrobium aurantiacum]|uniref:Multidrug export protein MepA n=1 Tax=Brumimicrobium aurantiacum TaxID=1737063 RepID=A0A3E1F276_9FLAO|nr:MATE family efflux transporter [Brumimicrobium aurantiacum]RFC55921.1 MATE family efflux transporter [Brumimicrobium aurantiacum]